MKNQETTGARNETGAQSELRVAVEECGGEEPCVVSWAFFDADGRRLPFGAMCFVCGGEWLALRAVFGPFEINRHFVASLLTHRPVRVLIERLAGVSLDLARIAHALGFTVAVRLPAITDCFPSLADPLCWRWVSGVLHCADDLLAPLQAADEIGVRALFPGLPAAASVLPARPASGAAAIFGYEAYALGRRDHALLFAMQEDFAAHFADCEAVVDAGCGTGVFLEILARRGIAALGVERNPMSARYACSLGHKVFEADALDWLEAHPASCDGLYCSHFIEHLPAAGAERLLAAVAGALRPGGRALFVFPDPESIRSQLLGFWRDPEHVRFYHPELVAMLAEIHGLALEYDSTRDHSRQPGRRIASFAFEPPLAVTDTSPRPWARLLRRLGIAPLSDLAAVRARADALEEAVRQLWTVNQTWAWDDNAVLRLRKHSKDENGRM
ncbi:MAG: class I SAM-dependent methyltransferase [Azoarcus sp.]|nr:class I SAM-dependent methyltransferase [Azoarcus sp.]